MKRFLVIILILGLTANAIIAQVDAHFSLFEYTQNIVNPGAAGGSDGMCFSTSHRQQWVGFQVKNVNSGSTETTDQSGRPISTTFSFDMPLNAIHSGIGLAVLQDKLGFQSDIQMKLNYAYRFEIKDFANIGIGLGLGIVNRTLNPSWITFNEFTNMGQTYDDPLLPRMGTITVFDLNIGATMYGPNYWAGIACTHLTSPKMNYSDVTPSRLAQQLYFMGGYTFNLGNPSYDLATSAIIQTDRISAVDFQVNAKFMYQKKFWAGISGRIDAIVPMVGAHLAMGGVGNLSVGYCYDIPLSAKLGYKSGIKGSHELMARFCFNITKEKGKTGVTTVRRLGNNRY